MKNLVAMVVTHLLKGPQNYVVNSNEGNFEYIKVKIYICFSLVTIRHNPLNLLKKL